MRGTNVEFWIVLAVGLLISVSLSSVLSERLARTSPSSKPYAWGYFTGAMGFVTSAYYCVSFFAAASEYFGSTKEALVTWALYFGTMAVASALIVARSRVGWIVGVPLSLNPILWYVNYVYCRNRWTEFPWFPQNMSNRFRAWHPHVRLAIAGSAFWAVVVLGIVFAFEPYGGYIGPDEWRKTYKIILVPPFLVLLGIALYRLSTKNDSASSN